MMFWNGGWAWVWLAMIPMMLLVWAVIGMLVLPWMRTGREQSRSAIDRLDERFAAGEIGVEEYRARREELERHSRT